MRKALLLLLLCGCSTAPIKLVTYDRDIDLDHDLEHICRFTPKDGRLDCMGQRRTVEAAFKEILGLVEMQCYVDGQRRPCSCNVGK